MDGLGKTRTLPLTCGFCGDVVVLGTQAQTVVFSSGFVVPVVHEWLCKESLYPVC